MLARRLVMIKYGAHEKKIKADYGRYLPGQFPIDSCQTLIYSKDLFFIQVSRGLSTDIKGAVNRFSITHGLSCILYIHSIKKLMQHQRKC